MGRTTSPRPAEVRVRTATAGDAKHWRRLLDGLGSNGLYLDVTHDQARTALLARAATGPVLLQGGMTGPETSRETRYGATHETTPSATAGALDQVPVTSKNLTGSTRRLPISPLEPTSWLGHSSVGGMTSPPALPFFPDRTRDGRYGGREARVVLTIVEETLLLLHDERRADFVPALRVGSLDIVLAGAALADLALAGRIDTDLDSLTLVDRTPLGDDLLDPTLAEIVANAASGAGKAVGGPGSRDAAWWIDKTAKRGPEIRSVALARLGELGILEPTSDGAVHLTSRASRSRRYAGGDGQPVDDVRLRIMRVLFSDDIPDPRDAVIIALAEASGAFGGILSESERSEAQERIDLFRQIDLIGRSVAEALRKVGKRDVPAAPPARTIPQAPGLPLLGNALAMQRNLHEFLVEQYRALGPVFRIRAPGHDMVVLAGPEANLFIKSAGRFVRTKETWLDYTRAVGAGQIVAGIDGPEHSRMRKEAGFGFSPKIMEGRVGEAVRVLRDEFDRSKIGASLSGLRTWRRIVVEQLAVLSANRSVLDHMDDIGTFIENMLQTHVTRQQPRFLLHRPRFRRAHRRIDELAERILAEHEPERRGGKPRDHVDVLVDLHRRDPQFMPETDLLEQVLGPFLAGYDTAANIIAVAFYHLMKLPELRARVAAEADALFAGGVPTARDLCRMDVTQRVLMESMRRYPIAVALVPRKVANSFEFEGCRVSAGETVLCAFNLCCLMPEYFSDPLRFDIERFAPGRDEHRRRGVFSPFGLGTHSCLGGTLAQALCALDLATAAREVDAALPPRSEMKIERGFTMRPSYEFRFLGRRETS